jgi:hypothetical protein
MRRWSWIVLIVACMAVLTMGACGSSYQGLSKAEFVKRALAICAKSEARANKIVSAPRQDGSIDGYKRVYVDELLPSLSAGVAQLRALKPPKADRKTISKMLDDLSTGLDQFSVEMKSLKSDNDIVSLKEPPALTAASREAKAYGIGPCIGK